MPKPILFSCFGFFFLCVSLLLVALADAYDSLDPNGNITIKWDVMQLTPDGYAVSSGGSTPTSLPLFSSQPVHLHYLVLLPLIKKYI